MGQLLVLAFADLGPNLATVLVALITVTPVTIAQLRKRQQTQANEGLLAELKAVRTELAKCAKAEDLTAHAEDDATFQELILSRLGDGDGSITFTSDT